ncbi:MAG: hypothetical protein OEZ47_07115 [Gammaproteobacteria bacterium]|nr:hypothetical protein [Gammaproteobacteria bacterium]
MNAVLVIKDETARGEQINTVRLSLVSERLSVKELISRRVQQEVEQFNLKRPVCFKALVKPKDAEETTQGFRLAVHHDLDWEIQVETAIEAFKQKCFFIMVNGKELSDLDDEVVITDTTEISFIRLMPIVGG